MIPPSVTPSARDALFVTGSGFVPAGEAQRQVLGRADDATFRAVFRTALARVSPEAKLPEPTSPLPSLSSKRDAQDESGLSLDADGEPELEEEDADVLSLLAPLVIVPEPDAPTDALSLDAALREAGAPPEGSAASEASLRRSPSTLPAALLAPAIVASSLPTLPGPGPLAAGVASSPAATVPTVGRAARNAAERPTTLHGVGPESDELASLAGSAWRAPNIEAGAAPGARPPAPDAAPGAADHDASDGSRPTLRIVYEGAAATSAQAPHVLQPAATPANDAVLDFQWPVNAELHVAAVHVTHQDAWREGGLRLERELDRLRPRVFDGAEKSPRLRADVATIAAALRPVVIQELAPRAVPARFAEPNAEPADFRGEDASKDASLRATNDEARGGGRGDDVRSSRSFDRAASNDAERRSAEATVRHDRTSGVEASSPLAEQSVVIVPEMPARPEPTMPGMTTFAHTSPLREAISGAADQLARATHEMARARRQQDAEEGANHVAVSHMVEARATLEHLGRVTVRLQPDRDPGALRGAETQSVRVTAERPETVELLHATKHDLLSDLQKSAPNTSSVSVGSDSASSHSHKQHSDRRDQGPAAPADYVMSGDSPLEAAVVNHAQGRVRIVL